MLVDERLTDDVEAVAETISKDESSCGMLNPTLDVDGLVCIEMNLPKACRRPRSHVCGVTLFHQTPLVCITSAPVYRTYHRHVDWVVRRNWDDVKLNKSRSI